MAISKNAWRVKHNLKTKFVIFNIRTGKDQGRPPPTTIPLIEKFQKKRTFEKRQTNKARRADSEKNMHHKKHTGHQR